MLKIDLLFDAEQANIIFNDGENRPYIGGDASEYFDAQPFCDSNDAYVFLCSDQNGIGASLIFNRTHQIVFDSHIAVLPHFRGKTALEATKRILTIMLSFINCKKLVCKTRKDYKQLNHFVRSVGFEREGICKKSIIYKNELCDQIYWGMEA